MTNPSQSVNGLGASGYLLWRRGVDRILGRSLGVERRDRRELRLLAAPAIVVVIAFGIFPLVYSVWVSFHRWEALDPSHDGTGFANYRQVLTDPVFRAAIWRTAVFVAIVVPVQTVAGLALALMVDSRPRLRKVFFPVFLLPLLIMPIVVGFMWRQMFESPYGMVNSILGAVSGHSVTISWLGDPNTAFAALVITETWQWTPFMFVVLLAGLTGVPSHLREAAAVDGAGWWRTFTVVVWPAITPIMTVAIILRIVESANFFATVYAITGGGPGTSTYSLVYYIAQLAQYGRTGAAAAASLMFVVVLAVPIGILLVRLLRRQSMYAGSG